MVAFGVAPGLSAPRTAIVTGALLSILPDADALGYWMGVPYDAPLGHRGLTHSLAFAAVLTLLAFLLLRSRGGSRPAVDAPPVRLFLFLFLCAASHGVLDGMTDGGLGIAYFAPFSNHRYFLPWRPIRVSPISITGFFDARGLSVLASECVWIWIPCALLALGGRFLASRQ
jgi:inner membrane protein